MASDKIKTIFNPLTGSFDSVQDVTDLATSADLAAHTTETVAAHEASAIEVIPSGNLVSTDVQSALEELQGDIDSMSSGANTTLSNLTAPVALNQDLLPASNGSSSLGSSSLKFNDVFGNYLLSTNAVGIGTTSPAYKIDISASGVDERIRFANSNTGAQTALTLSSGGMNGALFTLGNAFSSSGRYTASSMYLESGVGNVVISAPSSATEIRFFTSNTPNSAAAIIQSSGNLSVQSHNIDDVADPITAQQAATKNYVDNATGTFADKNLSNLVSTAVNADLLPGTSGAPLLGSSSKRWQEVNTDSAINFYQSGVSGAKGAAGYNGSAIALTSTTGVPVSISANTTMDLLSGTAMTLESSSGGTTINARAGGTLSLNAFTGGTISLASSNGVVSFNSAKLSSVATPVAGTDAANKDYVDGLIPYTSVVAKTGSYTLTTTDYMVTIDGSAGPFTLTLPTAVGVSGKVYVLKRTDQTLGVPVNIATTSSQTIDGSTTSTLMTQYETLTVVSDGSNWQIVDRVIPSQWTSYTPSFNGIGTVISEGIYWRRVGDSIQIKATLVSGTSTAAVFNMSLPSGLTADSSKMASVSNTNSCGVWYSLAATVSYASTGQGPFVVFTDTDVDNTKVYVARNNSSSRFDKVLGNSLLGTSERGRLEVFNIPITNWKA